MTETDREERIRERAHAIWEEQGRPEGRREEHWEQARRELETGDGPAEGLRATVTETIGPAVGTEPAAATPASGGGQLSEPATIDPGSGGGARGKSSAKGGTAPRPRKAKPS